MSSNFDTNSGKEHQIVFVGGGHAHALVLQALRFQPINHANLVVINPGETAPYSGMLPGFVAGHYRREELEIDVAQLSRKVGAKFIKGKAINIDPSRKCVVLDSGSEVRYDFASIDVGITSEMSELSGFDQFGVPAKPLENLASRWEEYRTANGPKSVAIIGGGIAGAELAMAMSFSLRNCSKKVVVKILDRGSILSTSSSTAQLHLRRALLENGVEILEDADVREITEQGVILKDDEMVESNFVVGAAGATPHEWIQKTDLRKHEGFVVVNEHLQSSAAEIFAVGDCAHLGFDPRPKAGVYAVRQAPVLLENLRRISSGLSLETYTPQKDYLKLVSLGKKRAFGEKWGWGFSGDWVWKLKDHIDRGFMRQFR